MTTPAYPNQIRMSQIRSEVKNPTTNQDLSLGGYRAGQGKVVAGAIGYPEGIRTDIPSSGAISMGNFHSFTNFSNQTSQALLDHVFSNLPHYFRYQMFGADGTIMPYPTWTGSAGGSWSGSQNDLRETATTGALGQTTMNIYFDGTSNSANNNDGSIPTFSEWTTYVAFSCGWSPIFNSRATEAINIYKANPAGGADILTEKYRISGHWHPQETSDPINVEFGGTGNADCGGWMIIVYWIPEKLTSLKRATQRISSGSGTNRPSSHGMMLLPGKWSMINQDKLADYVTSQQSCKVYRDDNTNLPFRIQTFNGTATTPHRLDETGDDNILISSQRKFAKWRFTASNTSTMAPILNTKEYIVETIDDTQFYIRDPDTGDYVYPTVSYAVGNANRNATINTAGGISRKKVSIPAGAVQFLCRVRDSGDTNWDFEFNTNFNTGYLPNDWRRNGPPYSYHPEEANNGFDRRIITINRRDDTDSNVMKIAFNTTGSNQVNSWKSTLGVGRFFFQTGGTKEAGTTRLNLKLESLF